MNVKDDINTLKQIQRDFFVREGRYLQMFPSLETPFGEKEEIAFSPVDTDHQFKVDVWRNDKDGSHGYKITAFIESEEMTSG